MNWIKKWLKKREIKRIDEYNSRCEKLLKDTRKQGKGIVFYKEKKII